MLIEAKVNNERGRHEVVLVTNGQAQALSIGSRPGGFGSAANGGELLCLAMATCYCNDLYREAAKLGIDVVRVGVAATAEFGEPGAPATRLSYRVAVAAHAPQRAIADLIRHTDGVAEVQNTLRRGTPVDLASYEALPVEAA